MRAMSRCCRERSPYRRCRNPLSAPDNSPKTRAAKSPSTVSCTEADKVLNNWQCGLEAQIGLHLGLV